MPKTRGFLNVLLLCAMSAGAAPLEVRNGVVLLPNADWISPFNRSFNLTGKSITFTRTGAGSFRSETGPLLFDDDRGPQLAIDRTTKQTAIELGFDFPFFGDSVRRLYVSQFFALYLEPPPAPAPLSLWQYGDADVLADARAVIAPLLTTTRGQGTFPPTLVYARQAEDRVVVTWAAASSGLAVQAVLFASGDIRFSYGNVAQTRGGAVLITNGKEAWRTPATIASADDPVNDAGTGHGPELDALLDITNVSVRRIAGTNVLQLAIRVRGAFDHAKLATFGFIRIEVEIAGTTITSTFFRDAAQDTLDMRPQWFARGPAPALRFEGDTLLFTFAQEHALYRAGGTSFDGDLTVRLTSVRGGDSVTLPVRLETPARSARIDFAKETSIASFEGRPVADTFTLPSFLLETLGPRFMQELGVDPAETDAVAFYQNYHTSYSYSTPAGAMGGNPGVDNLSAYDSRSSSALPRTPNYMYMNTLDYTFNATDANAIPVLMHELVHRWSFGLQARKNGATIDLAAGGWHPQPTLNTRAAFDVVTGVDCSVMGGSTYLERGNGMYSFPDVDCGQGLSWLDLYQMGLAAPQEVPPFFYLTDLDPPDALERFDLESFHATRNNLTMNDVLAAMGSRFPAYPDTQRVFRVLFVLVYDPELPLLDEQITDVQRFAQLLRLRFHAATNGRGAVETSFGPTPRRRSVRK
jgi:hypothetical protein